MGRERQHGRRQVTVSPDTLIIARKNAAASLSDAGQASSKAAAAGNIEGVASAFQDVGAACSACHRTCRAQ
jgi:cytochrome c556